MRFKLMGPIIKYQVKFIFSVKKKKLKLYFHQLNGILIEKNYEKVFMNLVFIHHILYKSLDYILPN